MSSSPNVIKFKFGGVEADGVKSSKGEVVLTGSREEAGEELIVRAHMSLQLGVQALYTSKGYKWGRSLFFVLVANLYFRNPLKFKTIECSLIEKEPGREEVSRVQEGNREEQGSQTEDGDEDMD